MKINLIQFFQHHELISQLQGGKEDGKEEERRKEVNQEEEKKEEQKNDNEEDKEKDREAEREKQELGDCDEGVIFRTTSVTLHQQTHKTTTSSHRNHFHYSTIQTRILLQWH